MIIGFNTLRKGDETKREYVIYGFSATFDDAFEECARRKPNHLNLPYRLPTLDDHRYNYHWIENALTTANTVKPKTDYDRFWTGGVYDASLPDYNNNIEWRGPPSATYQKYVKVPYNSSYDPNTFPTYNEEQLKEAVQKLKRTINRKDRPKLKDCFNREYLYV